MRAATDRAPSTIAWLLVLGVVPALGGCSISSLLAENAAAIRDTRDELKATRGSIAGLSQQLQSVDKSMQSVSGLEQPLHEVATLRTALEDATRLESALHDVAGLRDELHQVGELRESMQ
ncbi:MAG TPA: hypothetical protein VHM19_03500, partial [Polyangiales bacterium]|nr:hypothetical protein [Polyangiales bacterium]